MKKMDHFQTETTTLADLYLKVADKIENYSFNSDEEKIKCYIAMTFS